MNALELQDAILKAVDTLTSSRIDKIQADKTIKCEISKCTNALTGEYRVIYNGGKIVVYASEGATYSEGDVVYVLVPQADFTNKKIIVGLASAGSDDDDNGQSFVASALSDYNLIGKNVVSDGSKVQPAGLHSYRVTDYKLLYQHDAGDGSGEESFLDIDQEELANNIRQAEALMVRAAFQTRLPRAHRQTSSGEYGLQFVLAFKDGDEVDEDGNAATKLWSYTIDTYNMSGSPFSYSTPFSDYQIFPIDAENFLYVDSILFYCKNFVDKTDTVNDLAWGADIFVQDVAIYGLKKIGATSGDYSMSLSMPNGSTLRSTASTASLDVTAKVMKLTQNLSDSTMFYWFKEDGRVTASSEDYQMYGGAGWARLKDKGSNYNFTTFGNENKAYENNYKVVAVYKESVVLKDTFTLYNEAAKRDLSITSSLGVKFSFDRGKPTLTCLVDGNESGFDSTKPDSFFSFVWSKVDQYGATTIFNQTQEEAQAAYDALVKKKMSLDIPEDERPSYSEIAAAKSVVTSLEGISWDRNHLEYPVSKVDTSATFKCGVYLKDTEAGEPYSIGSATIVLQNESVASPTDYYITIENGDQVFQYSESGVAPNSDRYSDPLEVKPLTCHFYDPAGLEVNDKTYTVKWVVPLEDTLVSCPSGMEYDNASGKWDIYPLQTYPTAIEENYDYSAMNNQVECVVLYQGQKYSKYTDFLFTKIGENGTNGTDLVCKLYAKDGEEDYYPYIYVLNDSPAIAVGDDGSVVTEDISTEFLSFDLYQRNEKLALSSIIQWSVAGGNSSSLSKYLTVSNGVVSWSRANESKAKFRNQIIKASTKYEGNDYCAFYPFPVVESVSSDIRVRIDKSSTLKYVTYNADGRNPSYNKNQGVSIELLGSAAQSAYVVWRAEGGNPTTKSGIVSPNPLNADLALISAKNSSEGQTVIAQPIDATEPLTQVYVLPNDTYSGEYMNNLVHAIVYKTYADYAANLSPIMDIYVPIQMSLNTYGLKSLNAWDGNHVEVNEDENYILAPQIGAGEKDGSNRFTGIVMGKAEFYDASKSKGRLESSSSLGLLGYSAGRQSIFLNAEDGSATFGLPEYDNSTDSSTYTQGRIKLVPNGVSSIGSWHIGSRSLYNVVQDDSVHSQEADIGTPYSDLVDYDSSHVNRYKSSIPSDTEGVLLSAEPAYLSIKGRLLDDGTSGREPDADFTAANTVVQPYDSLELEMNPNERSIFTMYRHTNSVEDQYFQVHLDEDGKHRVYLEGDSTYNNPYAVAVTDVSGNVVGWHHDNCLPYSSKYYLIARQYYDDSTKTFVDEPWYFNLVDEKGTVADPYYLPERESDAAKRQLYSRKLFAHYHWRREPKVGINNNGRFYTNALKDSTTALTIGELGAYGKKATEKKYVGAAFEVGSESSSSSLVKFFTDTASVSDGSKASTLYMSGATAVNNEYQRSLVTAFSSYSLYADRSSSSETSNSGLLIDPTSASLGVGAKDSGTSSAKSYLSLSTTAQNRLCSTPALDITTEGALTVNSKGDTTIASSSDFNVKASNALSFGGKSCGTSLTSDSYSVVTPNTNLAMSSSQIALKYNDTNNPLGLELKHGTGISLYGDSIAATANNGSVKVTSNQTSEGIQLDAWFGTDRAFLHLTPQGGSSASTFNLASACGQLGSSPNVAPEYTGNSNTWRGLILQNLTRAEKGILIPGVINSGSSTNGANVTSLATWGEIRSMGDGKHIRCMNADFYGNNFKFNNSGIINWHSYSNPSSEGYLHAIISDIYDKLRGLQTSINNEVNDRKNAVSSVSSTASSALTAARNAQATADTKLNASTFNSHTHAAYGGSSDFKAVNGSARTTTIDGTIVVTGISTYNLSLIRTSAPK